MRYSARSDQKRKYFRKLVVSIFGLSALFVTLLGALVVQRSIRALRDDHAAFSSQLLASVSSFSEARYRAAMSLAVGAFWRGGILSNYIYLSQYDPVEEQRALTEARLQIAQSEAISSVYLYNREAGGYSAVNPVYVETGPAEEIFQEYLDEGFSGFARAIPLSAYKTEMRLLPRNLISIIAKEEWWSSPLVPRAVIINLDEEAFVSAASGEARRNLGTLVIIDRDGRVLASANKDYLGQDWSDSTVVQRLLNAPDSTGTLETARGSLMGEPHDLITYRKHRPLGWTFILAADSRDLRAEYYRSLISTLWLIVPFFALAVPVAVGLARRLYDPIARIVGRIKASEVEGSLGRESLDDIGFIESAIDEMSREIHSLSDAALHQSDAELKQLVDHGLSGALSPSEAEELNSHVGKRFPSFPVVLVAIAMDATSPDATTTQRRVADLDRLRYLNVVRAWRRAHSGAFVLEHLPVRLTIVLSWQSHHDMQRVRAQVRELLIAMNGVSDTSYSATLSEPVTSIEDLHDAAQVAEDLHRYRKLFGRTVIISPRDIDLSGSEEFEFPIELEQKLITTLRTHKRDEFGLWVAELMDSLVKYDVESFAYITTQVLLTLTREANQVLRAGHTSTSVGIEHVSRLASAQGVAEHRDLFLMMYDDFEQKYSAMTRQRPVRSELTVSRVHDIVSEHLSDHNLDLTMISERLNLSSNYLSRLFKDETGKNLTSYIRSKRMDYARHLLATDLKLSIGEVAHECGYTDVNYFSYSFRTYVGVAPSVYRSRISDEPHSDAQ